MHRNIFPVAVSRVHFIRKSQFHEQRGDIQNPASPVEPHELVVAAPLPFARVRYNSSAHHIEIDITKTIPKRSTVLDHRAEVSVLPECALSFLPLIVLLGAPPLNKLHKTADRIQFAAAQYQMNMIACKTISEYRHGEPAGRLTQACHIVVAIPDESQKERTIVTAVSDMIQIPRQDIPVRAWHGALFCCECINAKNRVKTCV